MNRRSLGRDGLLLDGALTPVSGVPQGLWVKAPGHESLIGLGWVRGEALALEGANRLGRTPRAGRRKGRERTGHTSGGQGRCGQGSGAPHPILSPLPTRPGAAEGCKPLTALPCFRENIP